MNKFTKQLTKLSNEDLVSVYINIMVLADIGYLENTEETNVKVMNLISEVYFRGLI